MDRFDRYALYLKAWGRGHTPGNAVGPASAAGSIGVHHHMSQRPPLSLDDFDAMFVPLEQGADEVARLRGEVDALERRNLHLECEIGGELKQAKEALEHARRIADDLCAVERAVRVALDAEPSETTPAAARRVVANVSDVGPSERDKRELEVAQARLRQLIAADGKTDTGGRWLFDAAADEIVRLRGEADDDKAALAGAHAELTRLGSEAHMAHEALEQARAKVDELRADVDDYAKRLVVAGGEAACARPGLHADDFQALRDSGLWTEVERGTWERTRSPGIRWREDCASDIVGLRAAAREVRAKQPVPAASSYGLSPEDADTLRGAGWEERTDYWADARGNGWVKNAPNTETFRAFAAELRGDGPTCGAANYSRAKAPPAAHGEPGKATGRDHAAGGSGSVAEEQGAAQGAPLGDAPCSCPGHKITTGMPDTISICWAFLGPEPQGPSPKRDDEREEAADVVGKALDPHGLKVDRAAFGIATKTADADTGEPTARDAVAGMLLRNSWEVTAEKLARSVITPAQAIVRIRLEGEANEDCIAALEALARGELRSTESLGLLVDIARANKARDEARAEAAALRDQHEHSRGGVHELSGLRREHQTDRDDDPAVRAERWARRRDRLSSIIQRHDLSAFARGYVNGARDTLGSAEVDLIREQRETRRAVDPVDIAKLRAALEAEAAGFAADSHGDALAQSDARALRRAAAMVQSEREARLVLSTLGFEGPAIERVLGASTAKVPAPNDAPPLQPEEPSGMRIEKRADGEWLVGASPEQNRCPQRWDGGVACTHHISGEHVACMFSLASPLKVLARWPIASAPARDESSRIAIPGAGDLHLFSAEPASRVDLIVPKALDPHDALRTVAELLGLPAEEPNGPLIPCGPGGHDARTPEEIDAAAGELDSTMPALAARTRAYARGIREGERRAKAKAAELVSKLHENERSAARCHDGDTAGPDAGFHDGRRIAYAYAVRATCNAFGIERPKPTGEPSPEAERAAAQAELDAGARVLAVHEKYRAKALELVTSWEASRAASLRLRSSVKRGTLTWARRGSSALIRRSCMLELSDAFDIPLPAAPTDPGGPAPEADPLAEHLNDAVDRDEASAAERAHAGGIVVGLRRAHAIIEEFVGHDLGPRLAQAFREAIASADVDPAREG